MVKSYASTDELPSFFWECALWLNNTMCYCYLMTCLANVPLSSVRRRGLRCARLCLRDGSAYTSFLRIHTQGSSRQSKLWGQQQHMHSVFNCTENKHTNSLSVSSCCCLTHTKAKQVFSVTSHKLNPNLTTVQVAGDRRVGTNTTCRHASYTHLLLELRQVILCGPVPPPPWRQTHWTVTR